MLVDVTEEDIKTGNPGSPCFCPVALALHRSGFKDAQVWGASTEYNGRRYLHEPAVKDWIHDFDMIGRVTPLTFEFPPNELPN